MTSSAKERLEQVIKSNVVDEQRLIESRMEILLKPYDDPFIVQHRAVAFMQEAISLLSSREKKAYMLAQEKVPLLVQEESNPVAFLRRENLNQWAAAKRLAYYWTCRVQEFGDRAFLPFDLTGEGALSKEDLSNATGAMSHLPEDAMGCPVLLIDAKRGKLEETLEHSRRRIIFYRLHKLSRREKSQTEGAVAIFFLYLERHAGLPATVLRAARDWLENAMPALCKKFHVVCLPKLSVSKRFLSAVAPLALTVVNEMFANYLQLHVLHSPEEALESLSKFGLRKEGLPPTLGGTLRDYYYDIDPTIVISRLEDIPPKPNSYERQLVEKVLLDFQALKQRDQSTSTKLSPTAMADTKSSLKLSMASCSRREKMKVYSREKRHRETAEYRRLVCAHHDAQVENGTLKAEHERLVRLLYAAEEQVKFLSFYEMS